MCMLDPLKLLFSECTWWHVFNGYNRRKQNKMSVTHFNVSLQIYLNKWIINWHTCINIARHLIRANNECYVSSCMCYRQTSAIIKGNQNVKEEHFWTKIAALHDCIQQVFCTGRKFILIYKSLQGAFGMKDIDFMCFEKPFPSKRCYSLRWWKELVACVKGNGIIRKIKQPFSELYSRIILIFSHFYLYRAYY